MNPNSFSILGYLSVLLWLAVPVLWLLRRRITLPGWLGLALAVLAFAFANINSASHVSRIEIKQTEAAVNQLDAAAAKRKAIEQARGGEVADIRFAEDGADDFIDTAGMDDADRKYLDSVDESAEPEWKKKKKKRGDTNEESGDLDETLGGDEVISGVKSDSLPDEDDKRPPILMSEAHKMTADRLDGINLSATRISILLGVLILLIDYLSRANSYARATFPLPLPAALLNAFHPLPSVVHRPDPARRSMPEELAWLARRGDVFVCFTRDASVFPKSLPRLPKFGEPVDVIHVNDDRITDEFVFESLWYGRSCFVVDSYERIGQLFGSIYTQLELRKAARARSKFNIHLIWNVAEDLHEDDIAAVENLVSNTGFSLFICKENPS